MYFLFMYFAFNQISSWDRSWVQHKKIYFFAPHRIPLPLNLVCERISMWLLDIGRSNAEQSNAEQCRAIQSNAEQCRAMKSNAEQVPSAHLYDVGTLDLDDAQGEALTARLHLSNTVTRWLFNPPIPPPTPPLPPVAHLPPPSYSLTFCPPLLRTANIYPRWNQLEDNWNLKNLKMSNKLFFGIFCDFELSDLLR